jgi:hypothetical protein
MLHRGHQRANFNFREEELFGGLTEATEPLKQARTKSFGHSVV